MTHYVLGFYFNETMDEVVLIEKQKPEWQKGLLNGLGGKIEVPECGEEAMQREFKEECGINVSASEWVKVAIMSGNDWDVQVFYYKEKNKQKFEAADSKESEIVITIQVGDITEYDIVSNLQWLIPMCVDAGLYENTRYKTMIQF